MQVFHGVRPSQPPRPRVYTGWRTDDPTLRIKTFPEYEFHTWTEDEIVQYEERWPIGSRERTAFALHLYTGQRRSDVARMAWTDVADNAINVVQARTGVRLTIPLHPNLSVALRAWPRKHVVMLTTASNKPFSTAGYGNMMADSIAAAGLPDRCVLHGLRKAAARRLAEAGCTEKEIAAVTGHTTSQGSGTLYPGGRPEAACCWRCCQAHGTKAGQKFPTLEVRVGKKRKKINHFNDNLRRWCPWRGLHQRD